MDQLSEHVLSADWTGTGITIIMDYIMDHYIMDNYGLYKSNDQAITQSDDHETTEMDK